MTRPATTTYRRVLRGLVTSHSASLRALGAVGLKVPRRRPYRAPGMPVLLEGLARYTPQGYKG